MSKCHTVGNHMSRLISQWLSVIPTQPISVSSLDPSVLIDFSLSVKAATLIFISGRGSAISSAKEGKSGFIYDLVKS